jgi:hypothetical protein
MVSLFLISYIHIGLHEEHKRYKICQEAIKILSIKEKDVHNSRMMERDDSICSISAK